jgi:hypothetical protein
MYRAYKARICYVSCAGLSSSQGDEKNMFGIRTKAPEPIELDSNSDEQSSIA